MGTDRDWENWGRSDPYFGVLSDERYRAGSMTEEDRSAFFHSGSTHVESLLGIIRARFEPAFRPRRSLDFGCGVGRLLIPLAKASGHATGVDVSASMLAEARRNCEAFDVRNVDFAASDDELSRVTGDYDLIHSHIVFAHINRRRGDALIEGLARRVAARGFIAVQVLYGCGAPRWKRALAKLRYHDPLFNAARNALRRRPLREPPMQLNIYDLADVVRRLHRLGFTEVLLVTDTFDHGQFDAAVVIAQRTPAGAP
ncbi:class I SAM-dependent methyltransferase [Dokdonella fugitiva]|nr:class I SAM-dependent methyltransferase [Dokdonella fugitiva]